MRYIISSGEKMVEYLIKAYIWITANNEEEAEEKLREDNIDFDILGIYEEQ